MHAYVTGELFKRKNRDFYDFLGHLGDVFLKFRDSKISKMTIFVHFWQEIVKKCEKNRNEQKRAQGPEKLCNLGSIYNENQYLTNEAF